jgi:hypothetical protein
MGTNHALPRNGSGTEDQRAMMPRPTSSGSTFSRATQPAASRGTRPSESPRAVSQHEAPRFDSARMMGRASWRVSWPLQHDGPGHRVSGRPASRARA